MALQVIGAGFGRTGTASLKIALEKLGYNKTYHMRELIQHPEQIIFWEQLEKGEDPDWEKLFEGYKATVDFPGCIFYKQIMAKYPAAKVILTTRNADTWWQSAHDTIFAASQDSTSRVMLKVLGVFIPKLRNMSRVFSFARRIIWEKMYEEKFLNKEFAKSVFRKFNEDVVAYVPKEKLLVFEIKDGWKPLCKFLDVDVPNEPFPRVNDTEEFNNRRKFFGRKKT